VEAEFERLPGQPPTPKKAYKAERNQGQILLVHPMVFGEFIVAQLEDPKSPYWKVIFARTNCLH